MSEIDQNFFFSQLSRTSKLIVLSAVFALFAPLSTILVSPVGQGWNWIGICGWFFASGLIATTWAYFFFEGKHYWIPPLVTVVVSAMFPVISRFVPELIIAPLSVVSAISVGLIVIGYVGFVVFISLEGSKTVKLQTELSVARSIHSYIVPDIDISNSQLDICGRSLASADMGGDFTDVTSRGESTYITIADISGHGVRAGVIMTAVKGSLLTSLASADTSDTPANFLDGVNTTLYRLKAPDMFCTLATAVITPDGAGQVFNAGHPPVLHYHRATGQVTYIESTCIPLGVSNELNCAGTNFTAGPGDVLALLTDGLMEIEGPTGDHLPLETFAEILQTHHTAQPSELAEKFMKRAQEYGPADDDQSIIIVRVK